MLSKTTLIVGLVTVLCGCGLILQGDDESMHEHIPTLLEEYKVENGHYPKTQSSEEIIHKYLHLNGNEYYPDYFNYTYDSIQDSYVLEIMLGHDKPLIIDSEKIKSQSK